MKNLKHIEQGSIEWQQVKWGLIGGTLSKGLFVKSDTLLIDILSQKLEEFEPEGTFSNDAMDRGTNFEPFAIQYLEQYTGLKFLKTGILISDEIPLLCVSPDGITETEVEACEVKCLGRKAHTAIILADEIPLDKLNQLVHYFTVNPKLERLWFCAYRPESVKNFVKELTPDSVVNLGTKARPVEKKISEWVELAKEAAKELQEQLDEAMEQLESV